MIGSLEIAGIQMNITKISRGLFRFLFLPCPFHRPLNLLFANRSIRLVFPTAESPNIKIFTFIFCAVLDDGTTASTDDDEDDPSLARFLELGRTMFFNLGARFDFFQDAFTIFFSFSGGRGGDEFFNAACKACEEGMKGIFQRKDANERKSLARPRERRSLARPKERNVNG